ncbi:hypothetical protein CPB85DRAFT_1352377 [Mucidula mucida]|nr:hypothetical protein CPB85DRAFT_1352377 [Mucidula mucida]
MYNKENHVTSTPSKRSVIARAKQGTKKSELFMVPLASTNDADADTTHQASPHVSPKKAEQARAPVDESTSPASSQAPSSPLRDPTLNDRDWICALKKAQPFIRERENHYREVSPDHDTDEYDDPSGLVVRTGQVGYPDSLEHDPESPRSSQELKNEEYL